MHFMQGKSAESACWGLAIVFVILMTPALVFANDEFAARVGTVYTSEDAYAPPQVEQVALPDFAGSDSIWGASGRDSRGHIWVGVSANGGDHSAHLMEVLPESGEVIDRGDVLSELKKAGLYREGERQVKIHTKIVQAADGYLYFASTDEQDEAADGSSPPKWGSHLWRLDPATNDWEHLHAVPHGLTALAGGGRWIYALGLWDHVLYQYDTKNGALRHVAVGSIGGHMSRNLVADHRGHVYVPRLVQKVGLFVTLVEFDTALNEVGHSSLLEYTNGKRKISRIHGIIGFAYLADRSIVIATHVGYLYRIEPAAEGHAAVTPIGHFHPSGEAYAASLFSVDGTRYLAGVTRRKRFNEWVIYDLETKRSKAVPLALENPRSILYGSITRDNAGGYYVVGRAGAGNPLMLRLNTAP